MKAALRPRTRGSLTGSEMLIGLLALLSFLVSYYFFIVERKVDVAAAGAGLGSFMLIIFPLLYLRPRPVIYLDDRGIQDKRLGLGLIRWEDIEDVQLEVKGPFLCLRLKNPDAYLARLPEARRRKLQYHQSLGFRMINLDIKGLNVNALDLLARVRRRVFYGRWR